jgi:hypothetical protein
MSYALVSVFATFLGCTSKNDSSGERICRSEEAIACRAKNGCHGYAVCNADGTGYGACDCSLGADPNGKGGASSSTSSSELAKGGTGDPSSGTRNGAGGLSASGGTTNGTGGASSAGGAGGLNASGGASNVEGSASNGTAGASNAGGAGASNGTGGASSTGGAGGASTGGAGGASTGGAGGASAGGAGGASTGGAGGASTTTYRRNKTCDVNGQHCKCHNFASLGQPAARSYGAGSSTISEFESWLSNETNADVTFFPAKPATITPEWLANYDVILLQNMTTWAAFSLKEVAALQAWMVGGGGVIALSGYFADNTAELTNSNALLAGTGMSFLAAEVPGQTCDGGALTSGNLICPNSKVGTTSGRCHCWGNSIPLTDWDVLHPISNHLKAIGSFRGRAVSPGASGSAVIRYDGTPVGASASVGAGKVFLFGDDLVTYYSMWLTAGYPTDNPYDSCWNEVAAQTCTSGNVFQYKQFWYNVIRYVAPKTECDFVVSEPEVVVW